MKHKVMAMLAVAVLVLALGSSALASNLVTNSGFETGNFSGWTQGGDTSFTGVYPSASFAWAPAHSGTYRGVLGPGTSIGTLSQNINTVAGDSYTISFWMLNDADAFQTFPPFGNTFAVTWGSDPQITIMQDGAADTCLAINPLNGQCSLYQWNQYTFNAVGSSSITSLQFSFFNYAGYFYLDDISVTDNGPVPAVPEPASLVLMGTGLLGVGGIVRRRIRK